MRTAKLFLSLVVISVFGVSAQGVEFAPLTLLPAKIFRQKVESPQHLTLCQNKLAVFSVKHQSVELFTSDLKTKLGSLHLPNNPVDLASLLCFQNNLYLAVNSDSTNAIIVPILDDGKNLSLGISRQLPKSSKASDLLCNDKKCYLLKGKLFESDNLKTWKTIEIPAIKKIPLVDSNRELNPFEDWNSQVLLISGRFTKLAVNSNGLVALLDPFHAQVGLYQDKAPAIERWVKWGKFGARESQLWHPNAFAFLGNDRFVVSDSRTKVISIYNAKGKYLGLLGQSDDKLFSTRYVTDLVTSESASQAFIYLSDFRNNELLLLTLELNQIGLESAQGESFLTSTQGTQLHQNLFRRADVITHYFEDECLRCHDGTQSNHLYKFLSAPHHHPQACSACHDPHHEIKARSYLRNEPNKMCMTCHPDRADSERNHVWAGSNKKGTRCTDCHQSHAEKPKLLRQSIPQLCMDCHKDQKLHHRKVENFVEIERAKNLKFHENYISCMTCHKTHKHEKANKFLTLKDDVLNFCSSCHGKKSENLYTNFHKLMKKKGETIK